MREFLRLFAFIGLIGFSVFGTALAQTQEDGYQLYSDVQGNLYLRAPKRMVLLHGDVSIPLFITPHNGLLSVYESIDGWQVQVLTEAQWQALSLTAGHPAVSHLEQADMDADGIADINIVFHASDISSLLLTKIQGQPVVAEIEPVVAWKAAAVEPVTMALSATTLTGLTAGEFRVDESGAATYHIPLSLPAGIAGVQPQLAFSYNSSGGDGYMGMGWQFSGASAITRCPKNMAIDNIQGNVSFSASDRLCLDGQRLITNGKSNGIGVTDATYWSASAYHTELDGFVTVRRHGASAQGPLAFSVETKSGEIHYYGDISAVSGNDSMGKSLALAVKRYGGTAESGTDAFFDTAASSNKARLWALKAIKDVKGNYIVYRYHKDLTLGEHYLSEIHYTGRSGGNAPFARVMLNYASNTKIATGWQAGSPVAMTKLLTSVTSYVDSQIYRHYQLDYANTNVLEEKNRLLSIQECTDNSGSSCLPPTQFGWQNPPAITTSYQSECNNTYDNLNYCWQAAVQKTYAPFQTTFTTKGHSSERYYQHHIDINGDGYSDMVYPRSGSWRVRFGGGNNYTTETILTSVGIAKKEYAQSIDYNGDGRRDLLVANSSTTNWYILSYSGANPATDCGTGSALCPAVSVTQSYSLINTNRIAHGLESRAFIADIDGDGLEDIVYIRNSRFKMYRNLGQLTGNSHFSEEEDLGQIVEDPNNGITASYADMKSSPMADINGDGKTDIVLKIVEQRCGHPRGTLATCDFDRYPLVITTKFKLFVSNGSQLIEHQDLGEIKDVRTADLNGDGYTDILYRTGTTWYYRLSDGTQFLAARSTGLITPDDRVDLTYFVDVNGDGRTDILLPTSTNIWQVYLSRPSPNAQQVVFERRGTRTFDSNAAIQFADTNGDGKLDLLTATNDNGWKVYLGQRPQIKEHVVNSITNGWGAVTHITYKNITDSSVYFRQDTVNRTNSDYFSPRAGMYVVSAVSSEVNSAQFVSVGYQYGGLLLHKKGRGLLGFEVLRTTDNQTGVITETVYHQHFPYTGIPKKTTQFSGTIQLALATNTVSQMSTQQSGIFPYISASTEFSYQKGTNNTQYPLSKTVSSFIYDNYGNLTGSTVTQSDLNNSAKKLVTSTSNTFNYNETYRRYGRLTASSVTKTLDGNSATSISRQTQFTYNGDLLLATEVLSPGDAKTRVTTAYGYNAAGNITSRAVTAGTNSAGTTTVTRTSTTTYDNRFRYVATQTDAAGLATSFTYNNGTSPHTVTGRINDISASGPNYQTQWQYLNALGETYQQSSKGHASGDAQIQHYTSKDYCSSITCNVSGAYLRVQQSADGQPTRQAFLDKYGREIATRVQLLDGSWSQTATTYDSQGRPWKAAEPGINAPSGHISQVTYDTLGRVGSTSLASGGSTTVSYQGLTTVQTDPMSKITTTLNNYLGQTVEVKDHLNNRLQYTYDAYGNLKTVTAVNSNNASSLRTTNFYDAYGRKTQMNDQDKGNWTYSYNAFGELLSQLDAKTQTTTFTYDNAGRELRRYDPSGTRCQDYGNSEASYNKGKLVRVSQYSGNVACNTTATPTYRETYTYNSRGLMQGKLVSANNNSFAFSQSYDQYGRLDLLTYPSWSLNPADDIVIRHIYQNGALKQLKNNKTNTVYQNITAVNARGQATGMAYGNGVTENRSFIAQSGWLDTVSLSKNGTLHSLDYDYDNVGNVTKRAQGFGLGSNAGFNETFSYDHLHRVTGRAISNLNSSSGYNNLPATLKMAENYHYDHWGNITFKTHVGHYQYDNSKTNRLTGVWQNANFSGTKHYSMSYDNNGNVTHDSKRSFTYTAFDKPSKVTQGSNYTDFAYGPDRQLYRRTDVRSGQTTDTFYIDNLYERTTLSTGVQEHKFTVGNTLITKRSNNAHDELYLHKDGQGSTISITNAAGTVLQQFIYDPWGKQYSVHHSGAFNSYSNPGISSGYTGHSMVNDFDVIHMGGRTYNPVLGRFMQADPFIQAPGNLQNYNRYSYVLNNPMRYVDPNGYNFLENLVKPLKKLGRSVMKALGPEVSGWLVLIGSAWCGPYYAGCAAAGNYEIARSQGASSTGALRAGATAGVMAYAGQKANAKWGAGSWQSVSVQAVAGGVTADLNGGKFGHGFWTAGFNAFQQGPNTGSGYGQNLNTFGDYVSSFGNYMTNAYTQEELARFAQKNGMTLTELNILLTVNSFAGNYIAGSRYNSNTNEMTGFTSREAGIWGVLWDVNDTLLGYQGYLDASSFNYINSVNSGSHISYCHSLGTLTCNNLVANGFASSANLNSLPFGNIAYGVNQDLTQLGRWDIVNGFIFGRIFNWGATSTKCIDVSDALCHGGGNYR